MQTSGVSLRESGSALLTPRATTRNDDGRRLIKFATEGLVPMLDPQQQLFCYRLKKTEQGMVREAISRRYTMMTLLGLHQLEVGGGTSPFEKSLFVRLLSDLTWVDNIGDLGVLLWLCAKVFPERLSELKALLDLRHALYSYRDARRGSTMELAWFLTGLSYWAQARPDELARIHSLTFRTYKMLTKNQGVHGFFGHMA